jgi:hypothetical protein
MQMRNLVFFFVATCIASPAYAIIYDDCRAAIAADDRVAARHAAEALLRVAPLPYARRIEIPELLVCLELGMGEPFVFDSTTQGFASVAQASEQEQRRATLEAERERVVADRWAAAPERRHQAAAAQAAARKRLREAQARIEADQAEVRGRLFAACNRLYRTHPDETITNKLCFDVFFQIGLPDE